MCGTAGNRLAADRRWTACFNVNFQTRLTRHERCFKRKHNDRGEVCMNCPAQRHFAYKRFSRYIYRPTVCIHTLCERFQARDTRCTWNLMITASLSLHILWRDLPIITRYKYNSKVRNVTANLAIPVACMHGEPRHRHIEIRYMHSETRLQKYATRSLY